SKLATAEKAFQTHLKSLKLFLKALDETTDQGRNPNGIRAKATPAVAAPTLATRGSRDNADLPVPDAPTTSTPTSPTAPAVRPTEPAAPSTANPEALTKVTAALKAFNDGLDAKLTDVDNQMVSAWTKDRHWYSGWFGTDEDPRI